MAPVDVAGLTPGQHARLSFFQRLGFFSFIWAFKSLIECRVFIPRTYKSGDKPLPLLIDIHGGGFCIGAPIADDEANSIFAHKHGFVVVSIGYRMAPVHYFPTPPKDVAALMQAVLDDGDLPVDHSKVAVSGYSAGGNLALAGSQLHGLRNRVKAVISYYGAVDFVQSVQSKLETRVSDGSRDMLEFQAPAFNWAYVPVGQDRRDPLLSPTYAPRETLPGHLFIIGCEHDLLCKESEVMADKLAESETGEKVMYPDGSGWTKGTVRWELVKGEIHGFNQVPASAAVKARRTVRSEKMYADVASWLKQEVFI